MWRKKKAVPDEPKQMKFGLFEIEEVDATPGYVQCPWYVRCSDYTAWHTVHDYRDSVPYGLYETYGKAKEEAEKFQRDWMIKMARVVLDNTCLLNKFSPGWNIEAAEQFAKDRDALITKKTGEVLDLSQDKSVDNLRKGVLS